jgi:hypothetical protein
MRMRMLMRSNRARGSARLPLKSFRSGREKGNAGGRDGGWFVKTYMLSAQSEPHARPTRICLQYATRRGRHTGCARLRVLCDVTVV